MRTCDFDYNLPEELIADRPLPDRAASRMMVVHRATGRIEHRHFRDLPEYVQPGDLFVLNDTKVIPARYFSNDGSIELVRAGMAGELVWKCLVRPGRKMKIGRSVQVGDAVGTVESIDTEGYRYIRWDRPVDADTYGRLALPHYMNRESDPSDKERYQTIYAAHEGAIAAPTAGLHFTPELLAGVPHAFVTLHVGVGTFRPVKVDNVEEHHMHTESFYLPPATADAVAAAQRVIAVGTTSVRVLETQAARHGLPLRSGEGETDIFIYPGFRWQVTDALLTNFHLPQSTLIMLVSAFAGRELILEAYRQAVAEKYRFFSYGDCMLIL
ncbi:MAG: tRNA preQ1(34) S-adenosylmethionine ribosyltransferase-isomerase QueA [Akkermansiaceae bacterium]|nr:tRNA preQ1(34) S-adenosylmethionine ribosyltransferase-isomerase QueA [Akkermansiaceae bacterium]